VRAREAFKEANYAIDTFAEFVRRQSHELFRSPAAAFQLAANEPETSVVHQAAMSRWRNGQETRVWLRRLDKRQQPAFTLVYAGHRSGGEAAADQAIGLPASGSLRTVTRSRRLPTMDPCTSGTPQPVNFEDPSLPTGDPPRVARGLRTIVGSWLPIVASCWSGTSSSVVR